MTKRIAATLALAAGLLLGATCATAPAGAHTAPEASEVAEALGRVAITPLGRGAGIGTMARVCRYSLCAELV